VVVEAHDIFIRYHARAPARLTPFSRIDLDEINDIAGATMDTDQFDFETLGGLMFHLAGEIPNPGDTFLHGTLQFTVEEVENNRVVRVRMKCSETDADTPH